MLLMSPARHFEQIKKCHFLGHPIYFFQKTFLITLVYTTFGTPGI